LKTSGGVPKRLFPFIGARFWVWGIRVVEIWGSAILRCLDSGTAALRHSASDSRLKE
jgi:hypothetical protein